MITERHDLEPGQNALVLPSALRFLHVQAIREVPRLWVAVDPSTEPTERLVYLQHTGGEVPEGATYLGTAITQNGEYHAWRVG